MDEPDYYSYELPDEQLLAGTAPLWRRALALFIDLLVFNVLFYTPFMSVFQSTSGLTSELMTVDYLLLNQSIISVMFGVLLSATVIFCFYMALSEYYFGRTIGKN
ncbi:MAG: RDD family protein [Candidatus Nanoarchaeia archaeon]|jgi:hypothetical protein